MYIEQKRRSILKTLSWRVLATCTTAIIVYLFTKKPLIAISVGGVEAVAKMILYFFHERTWNKVRFGKHSIKPCVLWFTGLSGSGKSTLANKVYKYLNQRGVKVERLDGDTVRSIFPNTGFSKEDRDNHIKRIGFLASTLERNGVFVVSSFVSPYAEARNFVKGLCVNFKEVYVKASLDACESRDVKGLYKKARAGEIKQFTGIDDPYEAPQNPDIVIETDKESVDESFQTLKKYINKKLLRI